MSQNKSSSKPFLTISLKTMPGIGVQTAKSLANLGILTVKDLIEFYPYRYEDYRLTKSIADLRADEQVTIKAEITSIGTRKSIKSRRLSITEAVLSDETGSISAIWFNQPFLAKSLQRGTTYYFSGQTARRGRLQLQSPQYEAAGGNQASVGRMVPIYSLPDGIAPKRFRNILLTLLEVIPKDYDILPSSILAKHNLISLVEAWRQIHFPDSPELLAAAQKRLAFDELLILQLEVLQRRDLMKGTTAPAMPFKQESIKNFVDSLPYRLTLSQKAAAWEIIQDLSQSSPMNRLLQGDVGSGKTVVAGLAILNATLAGYQSALLAPTEILAQQHLITLQSIFADEDVRLALMTASTKPKDREQIYKDIESGQLDLIIGTHAIFNENVKFKNLGLIIVDEQHRFGVRQRAFLRDQHANSKQSPHLLSMTATPIPRTLALTLYGDLALSSITELPPDRKKPVTEIYLPKDRNKAYSLINREILDGKQCFIICPLVEDSDVLEAKSAVAEHKRLASEVFPNFSLGLVHGRLKGEDKETVMRQFKNGEFHILVSTSVVEVGIDVPNASVILIEGAERFGLAQLHQFRGRVSRSSHTPYCVLIPTTDNVPERLKAIAENFNGFILAELDLKYRGMGELAGTRQSGFLQTKIADPTNFELVKLARDEAENLLQLGLDTAPLVKNLLTEKLTASHPE